MNRVKRRNVNDRKSGNHMSIVQKIVRRNETGMVAENGADLETEVDPENGSATDHAAKIEEQGADREINEVDQENVTENETEIETASEIDVGVHDPKNVDVQRLAVDIGIARGIEIAAVARVIVGTNEIAKEVRHHYRMIQKLEKSTQVALQISCHSVVSFNCWA